MYQREHIGHDNSPHNAMRRSVLSGLAVLWAVVLLATSDGVAAATPNFTIGGTLSGLSGRGLVLQNNGGDDLPVTADGNFTFATRATSRTTYSITIKTPPSIPTQVCTLTNSNGTIANSNVTNVAVSCGPLALLAGTLGGGPGLTDGTLGQPLTARFNGPRGVATDQMGNVYVADQGNHTIRKITPDGVVSTLAGTAGQPGNTNGTFLQPLTAQFNLPSGIVAAGNVLYVADQLNHTIRRIVIAGPLQGLVTTVAGTAGQPGFTDGAPSQPLTARFNHPIGVAIDPNGVLYVADTYNHTIRKITITPDGVATVSTLAGAAGQPGFTNGTPGQPLTARFAYPFGITCDAIGILYVADTYNHTIRGISQAGVVGNVAGTGQAGSTDGDFGFPLSAQFNYPNDVTVDSTGNLFVTDTNNRTIRKISSHAIVSTVTTVAGVAGTFGGDNLGPLPGALDTPAFLAVLPDAGTGGRLVFADSDQNAILQIALP